MIIKGFGYDRFETILFSLPVAGFQLLTVTLGGVLTTIFRKSRFIALIIVYLVAIAGVLMIILVREDQKWVRLVGFWLVMCTAPTFPLMLSLFNSNTAGFTKKSVTVSMIISGFCVGSLIGPQLFTADPANGYRVSCVFRSQRVVLTDHIDCVHGHPRLFRRHRRHGYDYANVPGLAESEKG